MSDSDPETLFTYVAQQLNRFGLAYLLEGAQRGQSPWAQLAIPARYQRIPPSTLDVSVQDLAQLYAAFARYRITGTTSAPGFKEAVSMHYLIDTINDASYQGRSLPTKVKS